jgi:DNA gyrase/topoisomerase IV subunit A
MYFSGTQVLKLGPVEFRMGGGNKVGKLNWAVTNRNEFRVARFFVAQHTKTGTNITNNHKIYQMAAKYIKWPYNNRPNGHKIDQHLPLQEPPKCTQIGKFGLKNAIWQP